MDWMSLYTLSVSGTSHPSVKILVDIRLLYSSFLILFSLRSAYLNMKTKNRSYFSLIKLTDWIIMSHLNY